jgi:hypothetical protein
MLLCRFKIDANGLRVAAVGYFEALHCQPSIRQWRNRSTALDLTTSAPPDEIGTANGY